LDWLRSRAAELLAAGRRLCFVIVSVPSLITKAYAPIIGMGALGGIVIGFSFTDWILGFILGPEIGERSGSKTQPSTCRSTDRSYGFSRAALVPLQASA